MKLYWFVAYFLVLGVLTLVMTSCDGSSFSAPDGDESQTNYEYNTISCTQTITVTMTQEDFDAAVEAGEPMEGIKSELAPDGTTTITASQCVGVGNEEVLAE